MAMLEIEGVGRVQIDDAFLKLPEAERQKVIGEIVAQQGASAAPPVASPDAAEPDSMFSRAFASSFDTPAENFATTARLFGWEKTSDFLRDLTEAPERYESAIPGLSNNLRTAILDGDVSALMEGLEYLPRAAVEQTGNILGALGTRAIGAGAGAALGSVIPGVGTTAGGTIGAFTGPAAFEALQVVGSVAETRALNNGREIPNREDWIVAAGTAGASGALNAIAPGMAGIVRRFIAEAGTETLQSMIEQAGGSISTDAGLQVDPFNALAEGLAGGTTLGGTTAVLDTAAGVGQGLAGTGVFNRGAPPPPTAPPPTSPPAAAAAGALADPMGAPAAALPPDVALPPTAPPPRGPMPSVPRMLGRLAGQTVRQPVVLPARAAAHVLTAPARAAERRELREMSSESREQMESVIRVAEQARAQADAQTETAPNQRVDWGQMIRAVNKNLKWEMTAIVDRMRRAQNLSPESTKTLQRAINEAAQHVQDITKSGEKYGGLPSSLDNVLNDQNISAAMRAEVERLLWDLNTSAFNKMKKNAAGPGERLLTQGPVGWLGAAAGMGIGTAAGTPMAGAALAAAAPRLLRTAGRAADRVGGYDKPAIVRNLDYARELARKAGYEPGSTIEDLRSFGKRVQATERQRAAEREAEARVAEAEAQRQASETDRVLNTQGIFGKGVQPTVLRELREDHGIELSQRELRDMLQQITRGEATSDPALAAAARLLLRNEQVPNTELRMLMNRIANAATQSRKPAGTRVRPTGAPAATGATASRPGGAASKISDADRWHAIREDNIRAAEELISQFEAEGNKRGATVARLVRDAKSQTAKREILAVANIDAETRARIEPLTKLGARSPRKRAALDMGEDE